MTILWAGGEDTSVTFVGPNSFQINTGYRTAFARTALRTYEASGANDPPTNRITLPTFAPANPMWFHARLQPEGLGAVLNQQALLFRSPDGVSRLVLRQTAANGQLKLSTRTAAGVLTDIGAASTTLLVNGVNYGVDIRIDYSATGGVILYFNGIAVINYGGDPRTDSATQLNQVELASSQNGQYSDWSEIIIADQDTRSMALWTMIPQASGNTQSWTPNTVGNINETAINDANFVATTANNALSQWTQPTALPTGIWNVLEIVQNARVQAATTGPQHFDWSCRSGGADYLAGQSNAPVSGGSFQNFAYAWATNPHTGVAWTPADIAGGLQFGIDSLA